jgi:hypothetical protein
VLKGLARLYEEDRYIRKAIANRRTRSRPNVENWWAKALSAMELKKKYFIAKYPIVKKLKCRRSLTSIS